MQLKAPVSAVLIAKNEADRIGTTLDALAWCDEIVVVDSGSTDGTAELCQARGCRVVDQDWLGYGLQKQFACRQARNHWVLALDADEVPDEVLINSLQALFLAGEPNKAGYYLPRTLVFMGRRFKYGKEVGQIKLRLFDRRRGNFSDDPVHESVQVEGPTGKLKGELLHESYRDLRDYFNKFNRYTSLAADQLIAKGKRRSKFVIMISLPFYFWKQYLVHGNILNGYPGLVWSLLYSFYPVVKYLKVYEQKPRKKKLKPL